MEKKIKKAIIDTAKELINAVDVEDFEAIAKSMQFLTFSIEAVGRYNALFKFIDEQKKVVKNGKEKTA